MLYEFLSVSIYAMLGISFWMFIWTTLLDTIHNSESTSNSILKKRMNFKRKIGSHNYYEGPYGLA